MHMNGRSRYLANLTNDACEAEQPKLETLYASDLSDVILLLTFRRLQFVLLNLKPSYG